MRINLAQLLSASLIFIFVTSCATLPSQDLSALENLITPPKHDDTVLAKIIAGGDVGFDGESGNILLRDGQRALLERLYLIQMAEYSIDAQYFIWNSDLTGRLLVQQLLVAAERGVNVRLLIDGFSVGERNDQLAALSHHPNVEVKVFNPFTSEGPVRNFVNLALDFDRLNQRMHNKSFIVDGIAAITGGRNIGDGYFFHSNKLNFNDLDLYSVGAVVDQIAESYNSYWNNQWAIPISLLDPDTANVLPTVSLQQFLAQDMAAELGIDLALTQLQLTQHYEDINNDLIWAKTVFLADEPEVKSDNAELSPKRVAVALANLMMSSRDRILIESAYLGFDDEALKLISDLISGGSTVKALTNSKATNNLLVNHASYVKSRDEMLDTGIGIYELKPHSCPHSDYKVYDCDDMPPITLHAKSAVFDHNKAYIGSMNFNSRSAYLNFESAVIIESVATAKMLAEQISRNMNLNESYQMVKTDGSVFWMTSNEGELEIRAEEPSTSWLEQIELDILNILPGVEYF